ncbi:MAG: putative aminohydrolase SsnA [Candidatus Eiseniibacteriota bacterium]|nr:MAG: putative aminohydrolase SsnA [Candidatus Eisenbacteria bacterium]
MIAGGIVITLGKNNQVIHDGAVYVKDGLIADVGKAKELKERHDCQVKVDARNKVVMPGFICAHHHLYSTMARGFAPPGEPASCFGEILERLWWKLDKALLEDDVYVSALVPLIECIRNGTTAIFDHHASPSYREGSLDVLARAVLESGIRASLCYEVSDRNVPTGGLAENERFLKRMAAEKSPFLTGMMGLHASMTLSDETLEKCRAVAERYGVGYHIHVAEGSEDHSDSLVKYGVRTVERLVSRGICGKSSLYVHCIHLDDRETELIKETGTTAVHNPESNMNNAVGVANVLGMMGRGILVGLGTDGMASDMPAQMRCAYLLHRLENRDPRVAFCEAPQLLLWNNAEIAAKFFPVRLGVIERGAAADLAVLDYIPPTTLDADNFLGHFIFGMVDAVVDTTIVAGRILMRNKQVLSLDEEEIAARCRTLAAKVWSRI